MNVTKVVKPESDVLKLDEENNIIHTTFFEYVINIISQEESDNIKEIIEYAIAKGIEVFIGSSNIERFINKNDMLLTSRDIIYILHTQDESKYELLTTIIEDILIANKPKVGE